MQTRIMDCMDCHNRPSHNYQPPTFFLNTALAAGHDSKRTSVIKSKALEIIDKQFSTTDTAMIVIRDEINKYYKEKYPIFIRIKIFS